MRVWAGVPAAAILAAASLATGISASARPIQDGGVTAEEVARELQAMGYKAEIGKDNGGDPKIASGLDGSRFTIWFYGCKKGPRCASVQFEAAFDLKDGMSLAKINEWNRDKRFGSAYLDDEMDPYIQYDVDFERGATTEAIANAIEVWAAILPPFKDFIGF